MRNRAELNEYAKEKGVKWVEVAKVMGVSRQRLANIMREALNELRVRQIEKIIDKVFADKLANDEWR